MHIEKRNGQGVIINMAKIIPQSSNCGFVEYDTGTAPSSRMPYTAFSYCETLASQHCLCTNAEYHVHSSIKLTKVIDQMIGEYYLPSLKKEL
jgi:hypothetical protein